nr:hypothetical protein [Mycoplasmopsis bovis]
MPIDTAEILLKPGSVDSNKLLMLVKNSVFNWQALLIISVIALIFVLIELQSRTNMTALQTDSYALCIFGFHTFML